MATRDEHSTPTASERLMSSIIDDLARTDPQKPFMSVQRTAKVEDGFKDIVYGDLARAIDRCARWMEGNLGLGQHFPTITAYMNPMDFRHVILIFASIKTGYKMFFASPRNRPEIQVLLLENLKCEILFTPTKLSPTTIEVVGRRAMRMFILPELDYFLDDSPVPPYSYNKTYAEACRDPFVVMHSSGTTGVPKILVLKQGTMAVHDAYQHIPSLGGEPWYGSRWTNKRVFTSFPWVHGGGVFMLASAIYNSFTSVTANDWPISGSLANAVFTHGNVQSMWVSPSVLLDVARNPIYLENLKRLESVSFAGGILPPHIGDAIAKRTYIFGTFASSETGILPGIFPTPEDWTYYNYSPFLGHKFRHFANDLYELVLTRDPKLAPFQGVFYTFLDLQEYSMRDLYIRHPTKPDWWRSSGRVDDVVVFSDAKKLNPIPYESVIEAHKAVHDVLICGTGRTRPAVLIQPVAGKFPKTEQERGTLLDDIWPYIDRANEAGPVFGRLIRELVVFVKEDKLMARAGGKDTVQRKKSIELYEDEIEEAYQKAEDKGLVFGTEVDGRSHLI